MEHVSTELARLACELATRRDGEIATASEVLTQYITYPNASAYREVEQQVNALARSWDRMIAKLDKWREEAEKIEASVMNFYGD